MPYAIQVDIRFQQQHDQHCIGLLHWTATLFTLFDRTCRFLP